MSLFSQLKQFAKFHPTAQKVVFVPQAQFGRALEDALARQEGGWIGLTCTSVARYARQLARPALLKAGRKTLPSGASLFLAAHAASQLSEADQQALRVEGQSSLSAGSAQALAQLFGRLRANGVSPSAFHAAATTARREAEASAYGAFVNLIEEGIEKGIEEGGYADDAATLKAAIEAAQSPLPAITTTAFAVLDEVELSRLEEKLLRALRSAGLAFYRIGAAGSTSVPKGCAGHALEEVAAPFEEDLGRLPPAERCDTAVGAEQEVRAAFRDILARAEASGLLFDQVEIAYTDAERYLPLLQAAADRHGLPVTVSVGTPLDHTRPGQALRAWLEWIQEGGVAPALIKMLRGGLVRIDRIQDEESLPVQDEESLPAHRAATLLASLRYEPGRRGYEKAIAHQIGTLESKLERATRHESDWHQRRVQGALSEWRRLQSVMNKLLDTVPTGRGSIGALAEAARRFLIQFGPTDKPADDGPRTLDASARNRLLDQLRKLQSAALPGQARTGEQAGRLAAIINTGRVGAARPMPGHIFLVPLESAGFSGRERLYVVGLDSESVGNYIRPSAAPVTDPERATLEAQMGDEALHGLRETTSGMWAIRQARRRHRGAATLYTRIYDIRDGEPRYPSTLFLEWGGERAHAITDESSDYDPISIRSVSAHRPGAGDQAETTGALLTLDESEDWIAAFAQRNGADDDALFRERHPGPAHGLQAMRARASDQYTAYDGLLSAGPYPELDILGERVFSSSRLETLAATPYLYFLQYVLGIRPLDEPALEDEAWLGAGRRGTILHDTFERFMRDHADLLHTEAAEERLEQILRDRLDEAARALAPPSAFVEASTLRQLRADAHVFLQAERANEGDGTPHRFEFSFGMSSYRQRDGDVSERAEIALGGGEALYLRGKVDRIDRHPDGTLSIWDYKTGRAKDFNEANPLQGGKKMQWALYSYAVEELLGATVREAGYFFTSTKEMGRRLAFRPRARREKAHQILEQLSSLTKSGTFPMIEKPHKQNNWKYRGFERLYPDLKARSDELGDKETWDASQRPLPAHLDSPS